MVLSYISAVLVRDVLNNVYRDRWIGRRRPVAWPPRSPDWNPLDFYLWEHLKSLVYTATVDNEEALHCGCLSDCPHLPLHLCADAAAHDETCRGVHRISWSTSQIKCFRTHINIVTAFWEVPSLVRIQVEFNLFRIPYTSFEQNLRNVTEWVIIKCLLCSFLHSPVTSSLAWKHSLPDNLFLNALNPFLPFGRETKFHIEENNRQLYNFA
jgi:hypothetical protein